MKDSEHFVCECGCGAFTKQYQFIIDFRTVNFSDDLVYDIKKNYYYVCNVCNKSYTEEEINGKLKNIIKRYKAEYWENK